MLLTKNMFIDIPGYKGLYKINENGDILSLKRWYKKETTKLKPHINKRGYMVTTLNKGMGANHSKKNFALHILVAKTFLINKDNKHIVSHLDGNKLNNNINNLKWFTHEEKTKNDIKNGLTIHRIGFPNRKLSGSDYEDIARSEKTAKELADFYDISIGYVKLIKIIRSKN